MNRYISELLKVPAGVKNLVDLIAFNTVHADEELIPLFWTDQSLYVHFSLPVLSFPIIPVPVPSYCASRADSTAILVHNLGDLRD